MPDAKPKPSLSDRAFIIILGNLINSSLGIIGGLILVRVLDQTAYGTYSQAFLIFYTLSSLFLAGLPDSIYYFVPTLEPGGKKAFIFQTFLLVFVLGMLFGGLLLFGRGLVGSLFGNAELGPVLVPFSLFVIFSMPVMMLRPVLISLDRHRVAALAGIVADMSILFVMATAGLLRFDLNHIFTTIAVAAAVRLMAILVLFASLLREAHLTWKGEMIKNQLDFSGPLAISNVIGIFTGKVDQYVISMTYPPDKFAIYNIGAREIPLVDTITYSVGSVTLPQLVVHYKNGKLAEFLALWNESTRKVALFMLPLFVFFLFYARPFIVLLFTDSYKDSVAPFIIFLFLLPLRVTTYGNILRAMGFNKPIIWGAVITGMLTLSLNLVLIRLIGFLGPAYATVLVQYSLGLYYLWLAKGKLGVSFARIMPWGTLLKILCVASLAAIPASFPLLFSSLWLQLLAGVPIYGLAYAGFGWVFKVIRPDDLELVRRSLRVRSIIGL